MLAIGLKTQIDEINAHIEREVKKKNEETIANLKKEHEEKLDHLYAFVSALTRFLHAKFIKRLKDNKEKFVN